MVIVGLENAGKTTFTSQLVGKDCQFTVPTVGVNVENYKKGSLSLKLWDLGGQVQYREEWQAYAKT
jgi:small GTP-binding protein